jgi:hypothetical protein
MEPQLSFGELALRYDQGRNKLAQSFKSVLTPHPSLGDDTGRFVANTKTGSIVTFDKNGAIVPYVPHQGGKKTRRKANQTRKHSNTRRRIRRR